MQPYGSAYPGAPAPYNAPGAPPPAGYKPGAPPAPSYYGAPPPGVPGAPPPGGYPAAPGGVRPPYPPYPGAPPLGAAPPGYPLYPGAPGAPPGYPPAPGSAQPQYPAPPPGYPPYGAPPPGYPPYPGAPGYPPPPSNPYGAPPPSAPYGYPPASAAAPPGWGAPKPPAWQQQPLADPKRAQFFAALKQNLTRDYVILVDKSGSMKGPRWHDACEALKVLAPECCRCDPDGATICFFSTAGTHTKFGNIRTPHDVMHLFNTTYCGGTTDLGGALTLVLNEHFDLQRIKPGYPPGHAPSTILVITDGEPDDAGEVMRVIISAANYILADAELSITFIQVGEDDDATKFLKTLDDGLQQRGARFDIVDTITKEKMMGTSFADLIFKSIND